MPVLKHMLQDNFKNTILVKSMHQKNFFFHISQPKHMLWKLKEPS